MGVFAQHPNGASHFKILIIDPHPAAREGLIIKLAEESDFTVCGETGDSKSALQLIGSSQPNLVILDVALKDGGIEFLKRIREKYPQIRVLIWSRYREQVYASRVIRAGASGYIEKSQPTIAVVDAIRKVLAGKHFLSPTMVETMLRQGGAHGNGLCADPVAELSDRELEVFRLIGLCHDTQEIADQLQLSIKTVETYRGRIKQKFGVDSSAEILRTAVRWELENG